jgi:hypothetical protein
MTEGFARFMHWLGFRRFFVVRHGFGLMPSAQWEWHRRGYGAEDGA